MVLGVAGCVALSACQPALNWREVQIEAASMKVMLPCKPDKSTRSVPLGGQEVAMQLRHCTAAGATFAVAWAQLAQGASAPVALEHWRRSTLAHVKAVDVVPLTAAGTIACSGTRPDGDTMAVAAQWVAHGQQVVQMAIYVDNPLSQPTLGLLKAELYDAFFDSLKFAP